jgi:hypothetical protein
MWGSAPLDAPHGSHVVGGAAPIRIRAGIVATLRSGEAGRGGVVPDVDDDQGRDVGVVVDPPKQ